MNETSEINFAKLFLLAGFQQKKRLTKLVTTIFLRTNGIQQL
jgi:hypothetical protein